MTRSSALLRSVLALAVVGVMFFAFGCGKRAETEQAAEPAVETTTEVVVETPVVTDSVVVVDTVEAATAQ